MADCNELADYEWLTGIEAATLADELTAQTEPLHTAIGRLREELSPSRTHLLVELVELRQRAAEKFIDAPRMFFSRAALEQASDQWVAAYKAERLAKTAPGGGPVADLCCGIGGDLLALARLFSSVVGVDQHPVATHLAAANVRAVLKCEQAAAVSLHTAAAEDLSLHGIAAWHVDPDRRPGAGSRTTSPDWSSPSRATIERLLAVAPNAAVKLAPGAEVPPEWIECCELEWISRDRQCRQLVAWHGTLAAKAGRRCATILAGGKSHTVDREQAPRSIVGAPNRPVTVVDRVDRFMFDVDPAVLAARLTGALAAEYGLTALSYGPTYLTGSTAIIDPALACFEVQETFPLQVRKLGRHLRDRGIGQVEIKKRGIELDPARVRGELKLRGDRAATLLLTQVAGRRTAILAQRISRDP